MNVNNILMCWFSLWEIAVKVYNDRECLFVLKCPYLLEITLECNEVISLIKMKFLDQNHLKCNCILLEIFEHWYVEAIKLHQIFYSFFHLSIFYFSKHTKVHNGVHLLLHQLPVLERMVIRFCKINSGKLQISNTLTYLY